MKKTFLNIYFWPVFIFVTLVSLTILPLLLLFNVLILRRHNGKFLRQLIRIHGWVLIKLVPFMAPAELEDVSGGIDLPAIFVANHSSSIDPYLFGLLPYENAFITSWPFKIPIFNKIMLMAGYINSEDGWDKIYEKSEQLLNSGSSVIVWPEGHRSEDGVVKRFKKGAFQIAVQSGRPVVPVCISGSGQLLPPGKRLLTPSRVKMTILPAIYPTCNDNSNEAVCLLRDKARENIEKELLKHPYNKAKKSSPKVTVKVAKPQWEQS